MRAKILQLGDSAAIPIPKPLLDACNLRNEVEVEAQGSCLVIRSPAPAREGWEEAFRSMAAGGDDTLVLKDVPSSRWDEEEWEW